MIELSTRKKVKNAPKTTVNKSLLIFLLLFFIVAALILIPSINHNVSTSISAINAESSTMHQTTLENSTIFDTLKYERSIHILAMLLVGFGFLMVFIRNHGYTSITATFLAVSIAIPMYMIIKSFGGEGFTMSTISIDTLLFAEFAAASLLIAIGAPLGRLKMDQYIIMGLLFVPAYIFNEWLILESGMFKGFLDTGGSIVIHAFGAYFGLGVVSNTFSKFKDDAACENNPSSNQLCLLGSMVLWLFWPSFTSAIVAPERVVLTAINTIFALCGATLATYIFSKIIRGKLEIEDIANAALAGGVAIGSTCDKTTPGYAMLIGIAAGALSVIGYSIIAPKVQRLIKGTDTCGINNLHGMPGILGGVVAIFITGKAGTQLLGIIVTVCVAFIFGKITGTIISLLGKKEILYSDEDEFFVEG
ncbi:ammonium transporter [Clostridium tagluense]|uniref:ammonium transporter n=1 Tax=Clostridium tagluense TaxID=360422 RepID=UPI001CF4B02B|nr:ammonium transporter [Clostridium tagluense]MCB2314097.1 ammonium transporter [Clostridium tagluense]MCB2318934.1 ammonium transporter [Clostridium tagluense]MCB2323821.1 ammonium transporter [Clostridium tagluense]MCB2328655.1 ammonium transporter [Clostridium tagluense]MCB2333539.1 ammonium transporter [Clostridium tagluense]